MANIIVSSQTLTNGPLVVEISASAEQRVDLAGNPSGRQSVLLLKLLAAAQITIHEKVSGSVPNEPNQVVDSILATLKLAVTAAEASSVDYTL